MCVCVIACCGLLFFVVVLFALGRACFLCFFFLPFVCVCFIALFISFSLFCVCCVRILVRCSALFLSFCVIVLLCV